MNKLNEKTILEALKSKNLLIENKKFIFDNELTCNGKPISIIFNENKIKNKITLKGNTIFTNQIFSSFFDLTNNIEIDKCEIHINSLMFDLDNVNYDYIKNKVINNNKIFVSKMYVIGHNITMDLINEQLKNIVAEAIYIKNMVRPSHKVTNIQNDFNVEFLDCSRGILDNVFPPFSKIVKLRENSGKVQFYGDEIYLDNNEDIELEIKQGSTIFIERPVDNLSITCKGSFNIYFSSPNVANKTKINIVEGKINKTNNKELLNYKSNKIHKFEIFINMDFTKDDNIKQFYGCTFYNCCFNQNQMILDSKLTKCYFIDKEMNISNCQVV